MSVIDKIRRKVMLEGPETVNSNWVSPDVSIDDRQDEFSISFLYNSGTSVNMTIWLQLSVDGVNFSDVPESDQIIVDNSGSHIYDINGSGTQFARIRIAVTSGSIDVYNMYYLASQAH